MPSQSPLMHFTHTLLAAQARHDSLLCVGLDPDPAKLPEPWQGDARRLGEFCERVVDATKDLVCAFKPQIAYFAAYRAEDQLEALMAYIRRTAPDVPVILDAKRGDIGATAEQYAREAFERYQADAVTLSPYMGFDSIEPYLRWDGKGLFLLCRTSNRGGDDLQALRVSALDGTPATEALYEHVARQVAGPWQRDHRVGLVVGATYPAEIERVRALAPHVPLLIPGVGAQGGDAAATVQAGWRAGGVGSGGPIVVNSSRAILYPPRGGNGQRDDHDALDWNSAIRAAATAARDALRLPGNAV